jgi:hypothetical protein
MHYSTSCSSCHYMEFGMSHLGLPCVSSDEEVVEDEMNLDSCVLDAMDGEGTMEKDHRSSPVGDFI